MSGFRATRPPDALLQMPPRGRILETFGLQFPVGVESAEIVAEKDRSTERQRPVRFPIQFGIVSPKSIAARKEPLPGKPEREPAHSFRVRSSSEAKFILHFAKAHPQLTGCWD